MNAQLSDAQFNSLVQSCESVVAAVEIIEKNVRKKCKLRKPTLTDAGAPRLPNYRLPKVCLYQHYAVDHYNPVHFVNLTRFTREQFDELATEVRHRDFGGLWWSIV